MPRWKLTLEYDGKDFCGWQKQADGIVTVQGVLEDAVHKFSGEQIKSHVAGRTDAGVHARGQVAHIDLLKETEAGIIRNALNFHVRPHRVSVLSVEAVPKNFHARFHATARSYAFTVLNRPGPPALGLNQVWHVPRRLTLAPMQDAAQLLIGYHDFSTFRAQFCQAKSAIRTLEQFDVTQEGELILFTTKAQSFLYHQVRNMVGSLVMVGSGKWTVADFAAAFAAKDRAQGGPTAPPDGLCFMGVSYPQTT